MGGALISGALSPWPYQITILLHHSMFWNFRSCRC